jgi:glutamine phosphoribosylpyrophosphate amidotransferase
MAHSVAQIRSDFKGKTVLLVDDSIVRGTTSKELVIMVRNIATDGTRWAGNMQ